MKKIINNKKLLIAIISFILIIVFIIIILLVSDRKITCIMETDQSKNGFIFNSEYVIKYKKNIVNKVKITETITSSDNTILEKYNKQLEKQYSDMNKLYNGYNNKITISKGSVISKTTINYKEFDMKEFIKDNEAMKQYTKDNKLTVEGAKKLYESSGATCK